MNSCCVFSCVAAISVAAGSSCFALAPTDFAKKVPISVSESGQTALGEKTAANVPVLVRLSKAIDGFKYSDLAADGSDLAFGVADETGLTVYPHEIETWDPTGTSLVWVKVPTLAAATSFGMYYGNGVKTGVRSTDAWSDYVGVWHLDAPRETTVANSYGEYANATATKGINGHLADKSIPNEEGKFGKSFRVNDVTNPKTGNFNYGGVWVSGTDALKLGDTFTISGWFKNGANGFFYDHLFYKRAASNNSPANGATGAFAIEVSASSGTTLKIDARGNGSSKTVQTVTPSVFTDWVYLTFVYNGTTCSIYANGASVGDSTIIPVTDNDAALVFGNNCKVADGLVGDAAWSGWIDEVRLMDATPGADRIALEYAAMADEGLLAFGAVEALDTTTMTFEDAPTLVADADGHPVLSIAVKEGQGKLEAVYTNLATGESVTRTLVENATVTERTVYTDAPGLAEGATYSYRVVNTSPAGTVVNRAGAANFYVGALTVTAGANAVEQTLTAGSFVISRADAAGDLVVRYTLSGGEGTYEAMAGEATIPDGATSVTVELKPVFNPDVDADAEVMLTLADGAYTPQTSAASIAVDNSRVNIYARYVSTEGDDENDGFTLQTAKATIAQAVASLDAYTEEPSTVFIAPGAYTSNARLVITNSVSLVGIDPNPANTVFKNTASRTMLLTLNNAESGVYNLTLRDGSSYQSGVPGGANLLIDTNGGTASNCVITAGVADNHNGHGGGASVRAGLMTHCVVTNNTVNNVGGGSKGGGLEIYGGRVENCLIAYNKDTGAGTGSNIAAGVWMNGGELRNSTIAGNVGKTTGGLYVKGSAAKVENCVVVGNSATVTGGDVASYKVDASGNESIVFRQCVFDTVSAPNATCVAATAAATLSDVTNGDCHLAAGSPAVDLGVARTEGEATADLDGYVRVQGAAIDAGCYEYDTSAFAIAFDADVTAGILPVSVTFTATVQGAAEGDVLEYDWDYDGDGTVDETGSTPVITHVYAAGGTFAVTLTVRDVTAQKEATLTKEAFVQFAPKVLYVNGKSEEPVVPFASPETGAWSVQDAINAAVDGCEIVIYPGTYGITRELQVEKALDIHGLNDNPDEVVIKRSSGGIRIANVNKREAVLHGLTLADGWSNGGTGGGIFFGVLGGTLSNAVIRSCGVYNYSGSGGAVYLSANDALVTHCVVSNCYTQSLNGTGGSKGVVQIENGRFENCLVTKNYAATEADDSPGNIVQVGAKGRMTNCTIVDNETRARGIVFVTDPAARLTNCVIADNHPGKTVDAEGVETPCTTLYYGAKVTDPTSCFVNCVIDPEDLEATFKNYAKGDFTPAAGGPLCNAGAAWADAPDTDLAGKPRVQGRSIDIGCYEAAPTGFVISIQ